MTKKYIFLKEKTNKGFFQHFRYDVSNGTLVAMNHSTEGEIPINDILCDAIPFFSNRYESIFRWNVGKSLNKKLHDHFTDRILSANGLAS